jgi:hypothetical protein
MVLPTQLYLAISLQILVNTLLILLAVFLSLTGMIAVLRLAMVSKPDLLLAVTSLYLLSKRLVQVLALYTHHLLPYPQERMRLQLEVAEVDATNI